MVPNAVPNATTSGRDHCITRAVTQVVVFTQNRPHEHHMFRPALRLCAANGRTRHPGLLRGAHLVSPVGVFNSAELVLRATRDNG